MRSVSLCCVLTLCAADAMAAPPGVFTPADVFDLEYASAPRISPDGSRVAYVRRSGDIMRDRFGASLWMVSTDGSDHRALVQGDGSHSAPRWSPTGDRILFTASDDGAIELRVLYMDTREVTTLARLPFSPQAPAWSPDGTSVAFSMFVRDEGPKPAALPAKPDGAEWAEPVRIIDRVLYRADGRGLLEQGATQIFLLPADGGTPRQLTTGPQNKSGPLAWTPDGSSIIFSANLDDDWERNPVESDLYELNIESEDLTRLTTRVGPDAEPAVSPDGTRLALTGFDDHVQGYQVTRLSVLDRATGATRVLTASLDRSVRSPAWAPDGSAIFAQYDDEGVTKIARVGLDGSVDEVATGLGGETLGRPYGAASFTVGPGGVICTVATSPARPADVALADGGPLRLLTHLNEDTLGRTTLASVEEMRVESSADGRPIEAWLMRPPDATAGARLPTILEIHGGPFADYGPRFSAEMQLYAAAGYAVVYANPRGSTSYGEEFGNLIHHAYPGDDYADLMSVVDRVIEMGVADPDRLFVTGGSGGGVLTAWIVGNTDRFRAAVVAKPVINWTSFVLTSDFYPFFTRYWFPGTPWEYPEHYWNRSPLSRVGNVTTPTMLLSGEADRRTPISEAEQFYQALQLRGVPTRMVRVPGAYHGIAARPTGLIAKTSNILEWFRAHGGPGGGE